MYQLIGKEEDLDVAMPMNNLLENGGNYSETSGCLWNCYRNEIYDANENDNANHTINNNKTIVSKSFEYKTKIIRVTPANNNSNNNNNTLNTGFVVPLKYLSNLCRSPNFCLVNCEIEIDLRWSLFCVISEVSNIAAASTQ